MATSFPADLDIFVNPQPTDSVQAVSHAAQHANTNDAIEAIQSKVGIDNSTDTQSLDYRIRALENASLDPEEVQDLIAELIAAGAGISVNYDDNLNSFTVAVDTSTIATKEFASQEAANAQAAAQLYADGLSVNYDPAGSASAALADANDYTDIAIAGLGNQIGENYVPISAVGNIDGVASLDENGFIPNEQLNIDERIQDIASTMITSATHSNISVSYDDNTGKLAFTGISGLSQEEVQDFVAPLLNHSLHSNISVAYDDINNKIVLQGNPGGGGGASVTVSANPPVSPSLGDLWLDSDNGRAYAYDGSFWAEIGSGGQLASISATPPASAVEGSVWLDSDNGKSYIYDGMYWAEI